MEGLAAASSVAGVLSLAGCTIDTIVRLHDFFKDVSSASKTIERFLQSINSLIKLMEDVKALLQSVAECQILPGVDIRIAALQIQIEDCSKDVYSWLSIAREHHPGFSKGTKGGFKKFWVAVNKASMKSISEDIREHRHGIVASLSVLGRVIDVSNSAQLETIQETIEEDTKAASKFRKDSMQHLLRIDSLEQVSKSTLQYSHASMVSLASIASSIKAIERRLSLVRMSSADDVYLDQSATSLDSSLNLQHVKRRSAVVFALGSSSASDCSSDSDLRISSCAPPGVEVTFREEITTQTIHEDQEVNDQVIEAGHQINVLHDICMLSDSGECVNSNMMEEAARSSRIWRRKSIVDAWIYSVAEDEKWQEVPDDLGISSLLTINEGILSNVDTRDVKELVRLWAVFSRCHQLLAEGRRLENLTWRLMNREILCCQSNWLSERGAFVTKNADLQSKRQPQLNATLSQLESGLRQAAICDEDRTLIRRHSFDSLRKVGQGKGSLFTPRTNNNVTEIGAQNEGVPLTRVTTSSQSSDSVTDHAATTLFDSLTLLYPAKVAAYISKFQLAQKLEQQLSLLSLQTDNQTIQCHLTELSRQLERTKHSLIKVRERCLKEGHALYSIDSILSSCKIHDPATGLLLPSTNPSARHTDILALRRRALKESQRQSQSQSPSPVDVEDSGCMYTDTKRDTINKWLFKNLQSSPENAALHRLIMNCGTEKELDEKTWARLVVKYWSVDEAATGEEYCAFEGSTDEGVGDSNDCAKSEEVMMPWVAGREGEGKGRALKSGGFTMPKILERVVYGKVETSVLVTAVHFPVRRFGGEIEKRLAAVDLMMRVAARS